MAFTFPITDNMKGFAVVSGGIRDCHAKLAHTIECWEATCLEQSGPLYQGDTRRSLARTRAINGTSVAPLGKTLGRTDAAPCICIVEESHTLILSVGTHPSGRRWMAQNCTYWVCSVYGRELFSNQGIAPGAAASVVNARAEMRKPCRNREDCIRQESESRNWSGNLKVDRWLRPTILNRDQKKPEIRIGGAACQAEGWVKYAISYLRRAT